MRTIAMMACLLTAACRSPHATGGESYAGSRMVRVVVAAYVPEGPDREVDMPMAMPVAPGGVGLSPDGRMVVNPHGSRTSVVTTSVRRRVRGDPPRVMLGTTGVAATYDLPRACPAQPILSREGRLVMMRVDEWRTPDGGIRRKLSRDEVVAALCGDFRGRDVPVRTRDTDTDDGEKR